MISWLKGFSGWWVANDETFWRILVDALYKYDKQVDINQIVCEDTFQLIKYFSGKDSDVSILNRYGVFKKYLLDVSSWYFRTDGDSQYRNFSKCFNDFSDIEICFSFLKWDADSLNRLNSALMTFKAALKIKYFSR